MRAPANPEKDGNIFTRSAKKTKAVNLGVRIYRGGIRF